MGACFLVVSIHGIIGPFDCKQALYFEWRGKSSARERASERLACDQALHLGDIVKSTRARGTREETRLRAPAPSRLRRSLARSRAARFARPNRRACSQASERRVTSRTQMESLLTGYVAQGS